MESINSWWLNLGQADVYLCTFSKKECAKENTTVKTRISESIFILPKQNICFKELWHIHYKQVVSNSWCGHRVSYVFSLLNQSVNIWMQSMQLFYPLKEAQVCVCPPGQWSSLVVHRPATWASPGNLLDMQILRPHHRPTQLESLQVILTQVKV